MFVGVVQVSDEAQCETIEHSWQPVDASQYSPAAQLPGVHNSADWANAEERKKPKERRVEYRRDKRSVRRKPRVTGLLYAILSISPRSAFMGFSMRSLRYFLNKGKRK